MDINNEIQQNTSKLQAFALRLTKNTSEAEDLYQETVLLALKNKNKFKGGTNFSAWIKTIMRNTFINNYRKKKRFMKYLSYKINTYLSDTLPLAKNEGESDVIMGELFTIIDGLDEKFRIPFLMFYQGYAYEEIAKNLNLPLGTVKSRIFFARKHLKKAYHVYYGEREDLKMAQ